MTSGIIDIENGGFNENAGIVEIGIIVVDEELKELKRASWIVNRYLIEGTEEPCVYSDEATEVHGITEDDQKKHGMRPVDVVIEFEAIVQDFNVMRFIGHGIKKFDIPRLTKFFDRFSKYEDEDRFPYLTCTLEMAKENFECESYSLGNLLQEFGIENEDAHRALGDCEATLKLLIAMKDELH